MNALLIHDMTAAIERDAEDLSTVVREHPFTRPWGGRRAPALTDPDEFLESMFEQLRLGPPSMRRR